MEEALPPGPACVVQADSPLECPLGEGPAILRLGPRFSGPAARVSPEIRLSDAAWCLTLVKIRH